MKRIVLDTNIVIDALAERAPFAEAAQHLMLAIASGSVYGAITTNTVTDIYYLLRKHYVDAKTARAKLAVLFSMVDIIEISREDCMNALHHPLTDFEDAVLACCAERYAFDYIATRNLKDFKASPVPPFTPEELLHQL